MGIKVEMFKCALAYNRKTTVSTKAMPNVTTPWEALVIMGGKLVPLKPPVYQLN